MMSKGEKRYCEICDREANYLCGDCKSVAYCSNEHRLEHWKSHKDQCKVLMIYTEVTGDKEVN